MIETPPAPVTRPCWRCAERVVPGTPSCPKCAAPLRRSSDRSGERRKNRPDQALGTVIVLFVIQLATSIIFGSIVSFGLDSKGPESRAMDPGTPLRAMVGLEIFDSIVILLGFAWMTRPRKSEPLMKPAVAWALGLPAILGALFLNQAYHGILRSLIHARSEPDLILSAGVTPLVFFAYCVQPAIIEELFFRHLALDSLRSVMAPLPAALVSSLMFGLAHLGVPFSIPILSVVGLTLAWARMASGSLALPMILHAVHNFLVIISE